MASAPRVSNHLPIFFQVSVSVAHSVDYIPLSVVNRVRDKDWLLAAYEEMRPVVAIELGACSDWKEVEKALDALLS